jgi:choline dehydrogenase-like flavoprotein
MSNAKYDAIIIGAGAGGGVAADVLTAAGKCVLLLERGGWQTFAQTKRDPLRNQRLSQYGHNAGPSDDHPRVVQNADGSTRVALPWQDGYHANAAAVGGGTLVYGGQAWRFHPLDFKMASTYGVPAGSSLADWPIRYDDLAPHYEAVEHALGVCGDASAMTHLPPYARDYPMPPQALTRPGALHRRGAAALGWPTLPVPLAINSVPYQGRPACARCQYCVGFACPVDAKNGSQNTFIARAIASGRCDLITGAMVERIHLRDGHATGVSYFDAADQRVTVESDVVVAAGGAVETARLLLLSGLTNDPIGRHLQGHVYVSATGLFEEEVYDGLGPGVTTATARWSHGNDGVIGGGMLADDFIILPAIFWKREVPPDVPRAGLQAKLWMRDNYRRCVEIKGPIQDIPSPDARVTLDPNVKDRWGMPVARLSGATHPESIRTAQFLHGKAVEWVKASGATRVWHEPPSVPGLSGGQHQAGTCRMGDDPAASAVDRHCKVHGVDNLFVADGSVHVTNGGFNPFLTIMANAHRTAEGIVKRW